MFFARNGDWMISDFETAKALEISGDFVGALRLYRELYAANSADEAVILGIAQCALTLGNPELAFEFYVKLLIINHNNPWGYLGRSNILFRYEQIDRALSDLARAIELDTPPSELRIDAAAILNDNGYCELAIQALCPLRNTHFEESDFQCEWVFALMATKQYEHPDVSAVIELFRQKEAEDPFYSLCIKAWERHTCRGNGEISEILQEDPELLGRAQILDLT